MNAEFDVMGIVISTDRLILRPWQMSDVDDMLNPFICFSPCIFIK